MEQYYDSFIDLALSLSEEYDDKTPAAENVAEMITRAEELLGFSLSEQYKQFISHYDRIRMDEIEFYSIVSGNMEALDPLLQMYEEGFPKLLLPVANDCSYFLNYGDTDEDGEPCVVELIENETEQGIDFSIEETEFADLGEFLCSCMLVTLNRRIDATRLQNLPGVRNKYLALQDKQACLSDTVLVIKRDGALQLYGSGFPWEQRVRFWKKLASVKTTIDSVVGLTVDGRVKVAGSGISGKYKAALWRNVKEISTGYLRVYALKKDGTVRWLGKSVIQDNIRSVESWTDIVSIYGSLNMLYGIRSDGTVICSESYVKGLDTLKNVVRVCCADKYLFALSADGCVTAVKPIGEGDSELDLSAWKFVVDIASELDCVYGLLDNGTVLCLDARTGSTTKVPSWQGALALFSDGCNVYAVDREGYVRNPSGYVGTYTKDRWGQYLWMDRISVQWAAES